MNVIEAVRERRSVRTFDATALRSEDAKSIMDYAASVKNPYGIPVTWMLLDAKKEGLKSPVIVGTDTFIAGKLERVPHAEEAFGHSFEQIVLYAQSLGVGTTWIAGTMNRSAFERAMSLSEDELMPCVSPLGYPAKKMSVRESMMRKGIKADSRMDFGELFFDGSFDKKLTSAAAGKLAGAFESVRLAPSAVNKQPWRVVLCGEKVHFYKKSSKGYSSGAMDVQKVDMGIALCHFELAAKESGFGVSFVQDDSDAPHREDMQYIASYILT